MKFDPPLVEAIFLRRYKRFFADFVLDGSTVTAACSNTGRMTGILNEGAKSYIQPNDNPKRRLKWDWYSVESNNTLVGCHTSVPNKLGFDAVTRGEIPELTGYETIEREKKYGSENSRIDLLLTDPVRPPCYVEIKNVHMMTEPGIASFPDAVTERGLKHLRELSAEVKRGNRAVMLYVVQRADCQSFKPAPEIDPAYAEGLKLASDAGVEILAYSCHVLPQQINLADRLETIL